MPVQLRPRLPLPDFITTVLQHPAFIYVKLDDNRLWTLSDVLIDPMICNLHASFRAPFQRSCTSVTAILNIYLGMLRRKSSSTRVSYDRSDMYDTVHCVNPVGPFKTGRFRGGCRWCLESRHFTIQVKVSCNWLIRLRLWDRELFGNLIWWDFSWISTTSPYNPLSCKVIHILLKRYTSR